MSRNPDTAAVALRAFQRLAVAWLAWLPAILCSVALLSFQAPAWGPQTAFMLFAVQFIFPGCSFFMNRSVSARLTSRLLFSLSLISPALLGVLTLFFWAIENVQSEVLLSQFMTFLSAFGASLVLAGGSATLFAALQGLNSEF